MSQPSLVASAYKKFNEGQFKEALNLYEQASALLGSAYFNANINLCNKRLSLSAPLASSEKSIANREDENRAFLSEIFSLLKNIDPNWKGKKVDSATSSLLSLFGDKQNEEQHYNSRSIEFLLALCNEIKEKSAVVSLRLWLSVLADDLNLFLDDASVVLGEADLRSAFACEIYDAGTYFKEKALSKEALNAFKIATKYKKEEKWLQTLYWQAYKQSEVKVARKVLEEIITLGINRKTSEEWIKNAEKRLNSGSVGFGEIANALSERRARVYAATPNKIAYFLHNSLPYSSGGYATRAHGMAMGLKESGFTVLCVSRPGFPLDIPGDHQGKELPNFDEIDNLKYFRIFEPLRKNVSANSYMIDSARAIERFLIENKVDAVMAASNHLTAIPAGIAARRLGLPYFYEVRGFWEVTRVSREPEYEQTPQYAEQVRNEAEAAIHADSVFTLTTPMLEELVQRGVPVEKITLLPNSCDPSRFTPRSRDLQLARELAIPDNVPVIGYIGSFVQYEGLENLAHACALLLRRGIDFRLLLVGNENASGTERGPITDEILRVANEEGLASRLIMPGRVPHEQVEAYYSLIDIAPFPRKPQPVTEMVSPMKPLEALAMEKAVIVSSVRALTEMIIEGETGLVFRKGDIKDLAEKLEILINDSGLRYRLGKAGREWVEAERTWKKTASDASDVIHQALNRFKSVG